MSSKAESTSKEILIVDDTPANLRLLERLLLTQGYAVRLAPSGNLALMAIQHSLPDLILLDIRMPNMDGYEVCQCLKADERTCEIPVIFISALQEGSDKTRAFDVGGADYITKPFQSEEVVARIHHQLQLVDLQQQLKQQQRVLLKQNQQLQQEICDRKRIEAELSQEKTLLRTVIDAIPDLIFHKDQDGRYLFWNQAFEAFTGLDPSEILHQTDTTLFSPTAARWIRKKDHQALTTQFPLHYEKLATFPDQTQRVLDTYKVPVQNPDGELFGLIGVCRDITHRKATEDHLNRMTSRFSALISRLQAGILVENEERQIVLANQWLCDLLHVDVNPAELVDISGDQLIFQNAALFAHPEQEIQRIHEILERQQPVKAEEIILADGRVLARDYVPILSGDRFQGHLWQYQDITASKTNEQTLIKTSQTLKAFSHSLKQIHRLNLQNFENFDSLAEDYLKTGCQILNFSGGLIGFLDGDNYVVAVSQTDIEGLSANFRCNLDNTLCCKAIRTQQTIMYAHIGGLPELQNHPIYQSFKFESFISTPIFVAGEVCGSFCFFSKEPRSEGFNSHEPEIIELMAQSIGKFLNVHQVEQQRQKTQIALRKSETQFRQLAENIKNVFWILEPSQQKFTYVSPAYEEIWGRSCKAVLRDPNIWQTSIYAEDSNRVLPTQIQEPRNAEYRIVRPDGTLRWIRDRAFPILDEMGHIDRVVGIAEDITDLKHQEQALRLIFEGTAAKTGQEFFYSLVRYLAEVLQVEYVLIAQQIGNAGVRCLALWQNGKNGKIRDYAVAGTPCEQVLQGEIVFHADNVRTHYPQDQDLANWEIRSYLGVPLINSNQEIIGHLAVLDSRPMLPNRQPRELILKTFAARAGAELERQAFENEIQQARESADAANLAKSEFLANISHELRTPLNTILGFTQLILSEGRVDSKTHEYLDIVNRSGEHLLTLINDVLEMSKIEAGKVALHLQTFDLWSLLQRLEDMFSLPAKAKNLDLRIDRTSAVPRYIEADESKLRQILINLLGNAVKFTQNGHVMLHMDVASTDEVAHSHSNLATVSSQSPSILLLCRVEDTGTGIAAEELETLFEPFIQTMAGCRSQEGTGLGLPISQRFVQLMGGNIQVQTILGQGSVFSFEIEVSTPSSPVSDAPAIPPVRKLAPGQPSYRLLVVEDHPTNRRLLVRMLETVGFTVRTAEDGLAAVKQAKTWHPHLIWMDIRMPNMDGYKATRQIKNADLSPTPVIIALTASAFEEDRNRVLEAGCDDFVRKPFQSDQIFQKIAQYLPVRYLYTTNVKSASASANKITANSAISIEQVKEALKTVPQEWVHAMQQAAIKGSDEHILKLVKALPSKQSKLAEIIGAWAKDFQFDLILKILQSE
ncbi:MAG: response regulator [Leptolyngbya sp. SIO1D8]|nr:response regulator [Leptolyngbya sp. SIO1D8]